MRFKGTTILFILLVILGGYVYFTEYRGKEERQKQEESKKKAFPVEQKDISEITLTYPDHTLTAVRKGEKGVPARRRYPQPTPVPIPSRESARRSFFMSQPRGGESHPAGVGSRTRC